VINRRQDMIEGLTDGAYSLVQLLPKRRRAQLEATVEHLFVTGALHAAIALLLTILVIDFSLSYLRRSRDDGKPADVPPPAPTTDTPVSSSR
jgi:hypothetical protein